MTSPYLLYHKWKRALTELWPDLHEARCKSFTWLVVGLFLAQHVYFGRIARKLPGQAQRTSKETNLIRLVNNEGLPVRALYEPKAKQILASATATGHPLRLIIDGSKVGNGHQLLMIALAYRRRAIPLIWTWRKGVKGHSPVQTQLTLFKALREWLPEEATIVVIGDSEFGSTKLMKQFEQWGWFYALRQKGRYTISQDDGQTWVRCDSLVKQGDKTLWFSASKLTQEHQHSCHLMACWPQGFKEPWLIATNLPAAREARLHYSRRMWIEAFFGDCKRNGFDLEMTRLKTPPALSRLVLAVALLVVWLLTFGSQIVKNGQRYLVDRTDRRDLSLFRIGWDSVERRLANEQSFSLRLMPYF